jgi:hypothetical protein
MLFGGAMSKKKWKLVYYGEYGPIKVRENGEPTFGDLVRFMRKRCSISADELGIVYGKIAGAAPVTGRHIQRMEHDDTFFPQDAGRRRVLAKLLQIPPALLALAGLEAVPEGELHSQGMLAVFQPKSPDLDEYHASLQSYMLQGYQQQSLKDLRIRISRLHEQVLYADAAQRQRMVRLLCGYHLLIAKIAEDRGSYQVALDAFRKAMLVAREHGCDDVYAAAVFRRACMRLRYESFFAATQHYAPVIQDLERLAQMKKGPSLQLQGKIWAVQAKVKAHLAQDGHDLTDALRLMDRAETVIGQSVSEDFAYLAALDEERYFLDRAEVLMLSPQKSLRSPQQAQEYLDQAALRGNSRLEQLHTDRQIDRELFQARIYLDQGYYPIAATTAENAAVAMQHLGSRNRLKDLLALLDHLHQCYPRSSEVMSLELEVLKLQQPQLFV